MASSKVKLTVGSIAVAALVAAGVGLQEPRENVLSFPDRRQYEIARDALIEKADRNIPMPISEYKLLIEMLTKEVQDANGWNFHKPKNLKKEMLQKAKTYKPS